MTSATPFYPPRNDAPVPAAAGKVIIVTGATGPVGRALVPLLLRSNATVIACSRNADRLDRLRVRCIDAMGRTAIPLETVTSDLRDQRAAELLVDGVQAEHGSVDAVIHLVGGYTDGGVAGFDPEELSAMLTNQVVPAANMVTASVDALVSSGGRFVTISSPWAARPTADTALYASVKAGVDVWNRALADAFTGTGASAYSFVVNAVLTEKFASASPNRDFTGWIADHLLARRLAESLGSNYINGIGVQA